MRSVYIEACTFIDMAKYVARVPLANTTEETAEREADVWKCDRLLIAARNGLVRVVTSSLSIAECTGLKGANAPVTVESVKRFYLQLLASGRSGVALAQPLHRIVTAARDLRWQHGLNFSGADAIHVATAIHHKCDELLTRDKKIRGAADVLRDKMLLEVRVPNQSTALPLEIVQSSLDYPQELFDRIARL